MVEVKVIKVIDLYNPHGNFLKYYERRCIFGDGRYGDGGRGTGGTRRGRHTCVS